MHRLISYLYPICRSITGDGVRQTLEILKEHVPLSVHDVPTGTKVFDWTVPKEWNIRDAYIKNSRGEKIVDFKNSNLHVVSYSVPMRKRVSLSELRDHLFTLPEHPDWIPYRTSYYKEDWGFCISHNQFLALEDGEYEVVIDSSLEQGHLTYGQHYTEGQSADEILISSHTCHPSLCNDNLSGIVLSAFLAKYLQHIPLRYSYRFLFIPGTIGSITWLSLNESIVSKIKHGLVVACVGDPGRFTYKRTRQGNSEIDRVVSDVLKHSGMLYETIDFFPYGYDERQYGSPGFNLPIGCLMRTPHGRFKEYHTSADNLNFVKPNCLAESLQIYLRILHTLESNHTFMNLNPKCEPQLGRRGLYGRVGGDKKEQDRQLALLWVLNLSDGMNSLLDISEHSQLEFDIIKEAADKLQQHGLLQKHIPN